MEQYAGWIAYSLAAITFISFVALIIFFARGQPWGTINDSTSVIYAILLIPVAIILHRISQPVFPVISISSLILGIIGMITLGILQMLLVFKKVDFNDSLVAVLISNSVIGIFLIIQGYLSNQGSLLPSGISWALIISGTGQILILIGYWLGGQQYFLSSLGGLVAFFANIVWMIWLGRLFQTGKIQI